MNRKSSISLGPGASSLILIFVVLTMTILGMLSLMASRYDIKFSDRMASVTQSVYELYAQAEERHAEIDRILIECADEADSEADYLEAIEEALPEDMELYDDEISWSESDDVRMLDCGVRILPLTDEVRSQWIRHDLMSATEDEWN